MPGEERYITFRVHTATDALPLCAHALLFVSVPFAFVSTTASSTAPSIMHSPPEQEIIFLILHHLHAYDSDPDIAAALSALEQAFSSLRKIPTAFSYDGTQHPLTYQNLAARYPHIPRSYISQVLSARLPHAPLAPRTLLATGIHSTVPGQPSRPKNIDHVKRRLRPGATSIPTILHQQSILAHPPPRHHISIALLPKAFRKLKRLVGHHLPVYTTIFDHSARYIVTGSDDHLIKIWSTETAYLQHTLRGHDSDIIEIVKHPTRPLLVSASADSSLRVWDIKTGAALHVLDGGSKEVNAVQFSPCPDRPYLVSGGADGSVRLWNGDDFDAGFVRVVIPNRPVLRHATDTRHAGSVATSRASPASPTNESPMSNLIAQPRAQFASHHEPPVASEHPSSSATQANYMPTSAGTLPQRSEPVRENPRNAANSVVSGTPLYEVLSVCFNAGATRLAVSGTDCIAHVYAIEKPESNDSSLPNIRLLTSLKGHSENIIQVLFSRSGDTIVTACRDGTARMWKRTRARLPRGRGSKESVAGMGSWGSQVLDCRSQMQADARSVLSGAASGSACGSIVPRMRRASFPVSLCAAMWSQNDKYLLTSSTDTKIRIWHGETGQLTRVLEAHEREVYVMDCHPIDARIVFSAGYDGQCILWDIETGSQLRAFSIASRCGEVGALASESGSPNSLKGASIVDGQFSSDGLSIIVSDTSGAITLFGVGSGEGTALAPEEQFFADDCAPFRRDSQSRAVHESTGALLHLVPKGRLCDKELRPHPPELQPNELCDVDRRMAVSGSSCRNPDQKTRPDSHNNVRNRNRDALLQRAKEFRQNQEKEERRLLRDARHTRRRMIIEKEKDFLERDRPLYMPLRDFEVPDSECEDSDKDYDGGACPSGDSDSTSSSDENEEEEEEEDDINDEDVRSVHKYGSSLRLRQSKEISCSEIEKAGRKQLKGSRMRRRNVVQRNSTAESSASDDADESPGYVDLNDSDSDLSEPVMPKRKASSKRPLQDEEARLIQGPISNGRRTAHVDGIASLSVKNDVSMKEQLNVPRSLMTRSNKRMKIASNARDEPLRNEQTTASIRCMPPVEAAESKLPALGTVVPQLSHPNGSPSVGSHYRQDHRCDTSGLAGVQTPLNPSFTSERKETPGESRRLSKPVEDTQGDTASCFRPRRVYEELMDSTQPPARDPGAALPEEMEIDVKLGVSKSLATSEKDGKADGVEKSLLSDSPARVTRRNCRNRNRQRSPHGVPCGNDNLVDIDELAERELEILDAKSSRRRRRRKRSRRTTLDNDKSEHGEDGTVQNHSRGRYDSPSCGLKRQRREETREGRCEGEAKDSRASLEGSAWVRLSSSKHTYVPQLGDDVMYFPAGHSSAMKVSRSMGLEPLLDKPYQRKLGTEVLDGTTFGKDAAPLRFVITELNYDFPVSVASQKSSRARSSQRPSSQTQVKAKTMLVLTMRFISGGVRRAASNDRFTLSYFPVDAPEYLVLTSKVETALNRSWKARDRFRILFLNEKRQWQYYMGTIRSVKPTLKSKMWNTVEVEYDNTEPEKEKCNVDLVSPWELEPHDWFQGPQDSTVPLTPVSRAATVEPGLFPIIARELEVIRQIEPYWRTQLSWLDSLDGMVALHGYGDRIPCPMDLDTVLVRMCTGYYRHFCSYMHDIWLLKSNTIRFHGAQSEKGILANRVFSRIEDISEKIKAQYHASFLPVPTAQPYQNIASGANSAARPVRPRPSRGELNGSIGNASIPLPYQTNARHFPAPPTPRQPCVGSQAGVHQENASYHVMSAGTSSRVWNGVRSLPGGAHHHQQLFYSNNSLGGALPPVLPVMASTGAAGKGPRALRAAARGQVLRQTGTQSRRMNSTSFTRGQPSPPLLAPATTTPALSIGGPYVQAPYASGQANSAGYQQSQTRTGANSSQADSQRGASRKVTPSEPRVQVRTLGKLNVQSSVAIHSAHPGVVTMQTVNDRCPPTNRTTSPPQVENHARSNVVQLNSGQQATDASQRRTVRGGSTAGEFGTHSWSQSMEGAGGVFPLQASTSDSHLPVPPYGRSRSPVSPPLTERETATEQRQQGGLVASNSRRRFHEHSTISIAAAESTMSCGGSELQAATAESADVASEKPS